MLKKIKTKSWNHFSFGVVLMVFSFSSIASYSSLKKLKTRVSSQGRTISKLAAEIRSIDKKISTTNDDYLAKSKKLESLTFTLGELKETLSQSASDISKEYNLVQKSLNLYLLEVTSQESSGTFANPTIYLNILKTKISDLEASQKKSQLALELVQSYEQEVTKLRHNEDTLYRLIYDLEEKKKLKGNNYISLMEKNNIDQTKLDEFTAKKRAIKKIKRKTNLDKVNVNLGMPISDFIDFKKDKKGVTFKFDKVLPLYAPAGGQVSYAGDLSNYGKVIMVDHGKGIRSVFLGDISLKVEKGSILEKGQIVGYTVTDPGLMKSLYYEVRKKNKAQNTYNWLAKNNKVLKI